MAGCAVLHNIAMKTHSLVILFVYWSGFLFLSRYVHLDTPTFLFLVLTAYVQRDIQSRVRVQAETLLGRLEEFRDAHTGL